MGTGGVITKIPMSMSDAAQMLSSLIELVKKKVAEMLSKAGGAMGKLGAAMKKMKALDLSKLIPKPIMDWFTKTIKGMVDGVVKMIKKQMSGNGEGKMFEKFGSFLAIPSWELKK